MEIQIIKKFLMFTIRFTIVSAATVITVKVFSSSYNCDPTSKAVCDWASIHKENAL